MAPNITKAIESAFSSLATLVMIVPIILRNAFGRLVSPGAWRESAQQAPGDVAKIGKATPHVLRNGLKNFVGFFDIRDRGNDGPRR